MSALYLIPGLVCLLLGVVFLLIYRFLCLRQEAADHAMTVQAWAKLVDTESKTEYNYENRARTVYYGVYEYAAADGQRVTSASGFGYSDPKDIPGTGGNMVKVLYDPKDRSAFALLEEQTVSKTIWPKFKKTGILLTVLGVLLTAAAAAVLLGFIDPFPDVLMDQAENGSISYQYTFGG